MLTTQEAADLLGISRPTLVKQVCAALLDAPKNEHGQLAGDPDSDSR